MAKKRVMLVGALAAATVAIALSGCSSNSGSSDKNVTLEYWASNQGTSLANDKKVLTPVLNKFTKQTGIKVNLTVIGWNDLQNKINTAISSNQGPDVVNIGNTWGPAFQASGAFVDLSEHADAIGGLDKFATTALNAGSQKGKTDHPASVPLYGLAYGLYYNKALFKAAGITTPPTTWEEFVADAKKLTDPSKGQYGVAIAGASYTENVHFAFLTAAQNGAEFYDGDKPTFTSDAIVSGVQRYLDLIGKDKVVNPDDAQLDNGSDPLQELAQGKAAMVLSQNNADATLLSQGMKEGDYGVTNLPWPADTPAEDQISTFPAGINIAIFSYTQHLDQALKFVKYMTSEDTQATLDKPYKTLPVLKDASPSFTDDADEAKVFTTAYNEQSKVLPQVATEGDFESAVGKAVTNLIADIAQGKNVSASDIKKALSDAQTTVEAAG
ncbi:ABC transporter substrate-binding protein [Gryllotalpicola ginsengisoli]|uniref:ABC transporter substrate-binding protein n=1 Tax=Gryllotalpicola ginsengisoli TaxID=444608 RepID=UPI00040E2392|nr:sugar ABC transporter substrate-binding protein [Gryllotalpicola ginsengisoli]